MINKNKLLKIAQTVIIITIILLTALIFQLIQSNKEIQKKVPNNPMEVHFSI